MKDIWTVSELNENIKGLLEEHYGVLWVEGEISNLRRPASGHLYFTLKDDKSQMRAVIFHTPYGRRGASQGTAPGFELEDGLHITCRARLTVYSPRGEYQLIIDRVEPQGLGALQKAYEQLKTRLEAEGLFAAVHKKRLPYLPERIGIITSPTGAVIRDILHVTARRFPAVSILIAPVRVQGMEAPAEIIRALTDMNRQKDIDVIILARGGGSFEDLYPFNTEGVARAVFASSIPVISAIGHETDVTICDFVADLRAPTPSAAAELAVPSRDDLLDSLTSLSRRLLRLQHRHLDDRRNRLTDLGRRLKEPRRILDDQRLRLDYILDRMQAALSHGLTEKRHDWERLSSRLLHVNPAGQIRRHELVMDHLGKNMQNLIRNVIERYGEKLSVHRAALASLNPLAVLKRGYSLTTKMPEGWIVKDARAVAPGDNIHCRLTAGGFVARITEVHEEEICHGQG
ncbi:MAG: exodeoxyribonuclease VII large subunit [Syntrophales bacterium]|nr:exodeoxyribonuclease VII large subunit [Syntrophales bacterium]